MKTIEVTDDMYEKIKDCIDNVPVTSLQDFVGKKLFIRTVTYHMIGKVENVNGGLIELSGASVVFDSGNLSTALKTGNVTQKEEVGKMWVNFGSVTDIFPWNH